MRPRRAGGTGSRKSAAIPSPRPGGPPPPGLPDGFDWRLYLDRYPDLPAAGIHTEADAIRHWQDFGRSEERWPTPLRRPLRRTLACPTLDSVYLRATGDLVCWDDAGNDTVLQPLSPVLHYGREVWLGRPFEEVRRKLWEGRMPFPEACARCLVLRADAPNSSQAVDSRRMEVFQVEPSYHCTLDCPGCVPLAVRKAAPPRHLDPEIFEKILSDLAAARIAVRSFDFQGHGEPLLHPRLWELVRTARKFYPRSFLSLTTNAQGTVTGEAVAAGLDEIVCAIDGARPESYAVYRVGGRFDVALRYLRDFADGAKRHGAATRVIWKYILFEHNSGREELEEAQRLAADAGVAQMRFVLSGNGRPARGIRGLDDLPPAPTGPDRSFERHAPDLGDLALRLEEARMLLLDGGGERAAGLVLSVAQNLDRFREGIPDDGEGRAGLLAGMRGLLADLPEDSGPPLRRLLSSLEAPAEMEPADPFLEIPPPDPAVVCRTTGLVRQAREVLAYAPLVTGLRPLFQDSGALYPQFAESARGCTLTDTAGRSYIDWMSGYGSTILGYRNPEVEEAVAAQFACGPVLPFGHPLEVEVARTLTRLIPCAEMAGFGKNGSDMLTAAVRLARLATGRQVILYHGYHGFHDWFAAANPGIGGLPSGLKELIHEFPWGDLQSLERLFERFHGRVAAVVMEPAKQFLPGPGWLEGVRDLAHGHGALLVFDEIVTGFRIALGGAQDLFGVTPDLACFGKAMANGWPISALVGRTDLLSRWMEIGVDMTWRGETLSLAAARRTLEILQTRPVLARVADAGEEIRAAFNETARRHGVEAQLTGHAARLQIGFQDQNGLASDRLLGMFIDECLQRGVVTNGTLLPNAAHDGAAVERTAAVFDRALAVVGRAVAAGRLEGLGSPGGAWVQGCLDGAGRVDGGLEVRGWLISEDGLPLGITIEGPEGSTVKAERTRRPDVARVHPYTRGAQSAGWRARLPREGFFFEGGEWDFRITAHHGSRAVFRCEVVVSESKLPLTAAIVMKNGELLEA